MKILFYTCVFCGMLPFLLGACSSAGKRGGEEAQPSGTVLAYDQAQPLELKYSDLFSRVEIVPLDTADNFLLSEVEQLRYAFDRFFVLCDNEVFVFDRQGKGKVRINRRGQGREEYLSVRGLEVSEADSLICLLTYPPKLMYFSLDGKFVREQQVESRGMELALLPDRSYAVFTKNAKASEQDVSSLLETYREEDGRTRTLLTGYARLGGQLLPSFQQKRAFTRLPGSGEVLFFQPLSNKVYSVLSADSLEVKYTLDFGANNPPEDFPEEVLPRMDLFDVVKKHWPVYGFNSCWENSRYFYIQAYVKEQPKDILFDKQASRLYAGWLNDDLLGCQMFPVEASEELLVGHVSVNHLVVLEDYLKIHPDKQLAELPKRMIEWANNVGNPIVCLYYFK